MTKLAKTRRVKPSSRQLPVSGQIPRQTELGLVDSPGRHGRVCGFCTVKSLLLRYDCSLIAGSCPLPLRAAAARPEGRQFSDGNDPPNSDLRYCAPERQWVRYASACRPVFASNASHLLFWSRRPASGHSPKMSSTDRPLIISDGLYALIFDSCRGQTELSACSYKRRLHQKWQRTCR